MARQRGARRKGGYLWYKQETNTDERRGRRKASQAPKAMITVRGEGRRGATEVTLADFAHRGPAQNAMVHKPQTHEARTPEHKALVKQRVAHSLRLTPRASSKLNVDISRQRIFSSRDGQPWDTPQLPLPKRSSPSSKAGCVFSCIPGMAGEG